MDKREYYKILILRTIGNSLVLFSLLGVALTFGPVIKAEAEYRYERISGRKYVLSVAEQETTPDNNGFKKLLGAGKVQLLTPVDTRFGIVIPKIKANSRIIANVDAGREKEYLEALKLGVAHAKGTVFPGMRGNMFLFAHSTDNFWNIIRYNAVFYLLKELEKGDEIDIFFNNKRYIYTVFEKKTVEAGETGYIFQNYDEPVLTLQTCWPSGTTLKRLLILAKMKKAT